MTRKSEKGGVPLPTTSVDVVTWVTEPEWHRLFRQLRPTSLSLSSFQQLAFTGVLHEHIKQSPLLKVVREMRYIMEEHGWLRESAMLGVGAQRKEELSRSLQKAVQVREMVAPQSASNANGVVTEAHTRPERARQVHSLAGSAAANADPSIESPLVHPWSVESPMDKGFDAPLPYARTNGHLSTVPPPLGTSTLQRSVEAASATISNAGGCPSLLAATAAAPSPSSAPSPSHVDNYCSPMARVVTVVKRFQLRMGSFPIRFEIPAMFQNDIANRRLRVQVIPMTGNIPAVWPKVKEVFVFVNERNVQAAWKRAWPAKKVELCRAFLPLDITQYLVNATTQPQRLQLDCFNHEFCGSFAVVLVMPRTEQDVLHEYVSKLSRGSLELQKFYQEMMREDSYGDSDVVCDVPTVTLKCPISQCRMVVPVRGSHCHHLQCVDFAAFLRYCHISCYWNCPLCDAPMRLSDTIVDQAFQSMLEDRASTHWTHAQLSKRDGNTFLWCESEKHRAQAVNVSESDSEASDDVGSMPSRRRRRTEAARSPHSPPLGSGSADEPICL